MVDLQVALMKTPDCLWSRIAFIRIGTENAGGRDKAFPEGELHALRSNNCHRTREDTKSLPATGRYCASGIRKTQTTFRCPDARLGNRDRESAQIDINENFGGCWKSLGNPGRHYLRHQLVGVIIDFIATPETRLRLEPYRQRGAYQ